MWRGRAQRPTTALGVVPALRTASEGRVVARRRLHGSPPFAQQIGAFTETLTANSRTCESGRSGPDCSLDVDCGAHGHAVARFFGGALPVAGRQCICEDGWTGDRCQINASRPPRGSSCDFDGEANYGFVAPSTCGGVLSLPAYEWQNGCACAGC